ncbi:hypothetical protein HK101_010988 [Irineochytrium annulatum]|nr:hypothetical protein HK101_010988 [Irineochytrium annulatum]
MTGGGPTKVSQPQRKIQLFPSAPGVKISSRPAAPPPKHPPPSEHASSKTLMDFSLPTIDIGTLEDSIFGHVAAFSAAAAAAADAGDLETNVGTVDGSRARSEVSENSSMQSKGPHRPPSERETIDVVRRFFSCPSAISNNVDDYNEIAPTSSAAETLVDVGSSNSWVAAGQRYASPRSSVLSAETMESTAAASGALSAYPHQRQHEQPHQQPPQPQPQNSFIGVIPTRSSSLAWSDAEVEGLGVRNGNGGIGHVLNTDAPSPPPRATPSLERRYPQQRPVYPPKRWESVDRLSSPTSPSAVPQKRFSSSALPTSSSTSTITTSSSNQPRFSPAPSVIQTLNPALPNLLSRILHEFVTTERTYATELSRLIEIYLLPMRGALEERGHDSKWSQSVVAGLFSNVEEIEEAHRCLVLPALEAAVSGEVWWDGEEAETEEDQPRSSWELALSRWDAAADVDLSLTSPVATGVPDGADEVEEGNRRAGRARGRSANRRSGLSWTSGGRGRRTGSAGSSVASSATFANSSVAQQASSAVGSATVDPRASIGSSLMRFGWSIGAGARSRSRNRRSGGVVGSVVNSPGTGVVGMGSLGVGMMSNAGTAVLGEADIGRSVAALATFFIRLCGCGVVGRYEHYIARLQGAQALAVELLAMEPGSLVEEDGDERLAAFKEAARVMKRAAEDPRHAQIGVFGYLVLPLQRLTRYSIMLDRLLDSIPTDGGDLVEPITRELVAEAAIAVRRAVESCNEATRRQEATRKVHHNQPPSHKRKVASPAVSQLSISTATTCASPTASHPAFIPSSLQKPQSFVASPTPMSPRASVATEHSYQSVSATSQHHRSWFGRFSHTNSSATTAPTSPTAVSSPHYHQQQPLYLPTAPVRCEGGLALVADGRAGAAQEARHSWGAWATGESRAAAGMAGSEGIPAVTVQSFRDGSLVVRRILAEGCSGPGVSCVDAEEAQVIAERVVAGGGTRMQSSAGVDMKGRSKSYRGGEKDKAGAGAGPSSPVVVIEGLAYTVAGCGGSVVMRVVKGGATLVAGLFERCSAAEAAEPELSKGGGKNRRIRVVGEMLSGSGGSLMSCGPEFGGGISRRAGPLRKGDLRELVLEGDQESIVGWWKVLNDKLKPRTSPRPVEKDHQVLKAEMYFEDHPPASDDAAFMTESLERMLVSGVIEPVAEGEAAPEAYAYAATDSKGTKGLYFNFTSLRGLIPESVHPIPILPVSVSTTSSTPLRSDLSLATYDAAWPFPLSLSDRPKTAFATRLPAGSRLDGRYRFVMAPMDMPGTGAAVQSLLEEALVEGLLTEEGGLVAVRLNEIHVHGDATNPEDHMRVLAEVFKRVKVSGMRFAADRCRFGIDPRTGEVAEGLSFPQKKALEAFKGMIG